jgi:hypothetical protein
MTDTDESQQVPAGDAGPVMPQPVPVTPAVQAIPTADGGSTVCMTFASLNGVSVYFFSRDEALRLASDIRKVASWRSSQTGSKLPDAEPAGIVPVKSRLLVPGR